MKLILVKIKQFLFVTSSMAFVVVWAVLCLAFIRFRYWYASLERTCFLPPPLFPMGTSSCMMLILRRANKCARGLERLDRESYSHTGTEALAGEGVEDDDHYRKFISAGTADRYRKHVNYILPQPLAAYTGVAGCLLLIIVSSSVWWDNMSTVSSAWSVSVFFLVSFRFFDHRVLHLYQLTRNQEAIMIISWLILKVWNRTWKTGWISTNDDPLNPSELKDCLDNLVRASEKGDRRFEVHRLAAVTNNGTVNGATTRSLSALGVGF